MNAKKNMLNELSSKGYKYKDINLIFRAKKITLEEANVILKWIPSILKEDYGAAELLFRSLISSNEPFDPGALIQIFEEWDLNYIMKWSIANTLANAPTSDISEWLKNQLLSSDKYIYERGALVPGIVKKGGFASIQRSLDFAKRIFKNYPYDVIRLFKEYGGDKEIIFLQKQRGDKKLTKEIDKVVTFLGKKIAKKNSTI